MLKYGLRYMPLLLLASLLIPLRIFMMESYVKPRPVLPEQNSSPFLPGAALYGVTMLPSGDAWAVGGSFGLKPVLQQGNADQFIFPTVGTILHFTGNAWVAAYVASTLKLPLLGVSLDSSQDGWAVGWAGTLVHYDGQKWFIVPGPKNFNKNLLGVAMLSSSDGWAVGYSGSILHYDGKQWLQVQSPTTLDLHSIAMPSPQEGWAVGVNGIILHYVQGTWHIASNLTNTTLNSVSMLSTHEGWAVGKAGTILHYRDGIWESVHPTGYYQNQSPYVPVDFAGVAMNSIRSGWIIGNSHFLVYSSEVWTEPGTSIHLSSVGPSSKIVLDNFSLYSIALSPSDAGWAVGSIGTRNVYKTDQTDIILRYQGGEWYLSSIIG